MKLLLCLAVCIAIAAAINLHSIGLQQNAEESRYRSAFKKWCLTHSKSYNHYEFGKRFNIFKDNMKFVEGHDHVSKGYNVSLNFWADQTGEEFRGILNGFRHTKNAFATLRKPSDVSERPVGAPKSVDWRKKGAVTHVKNQGQCGSCWSFSTTGSVEGAHFLAKGKLVSLSEQNLVDCSGSFGNQGCNGGLMDDAFQYIISNDGIDTEASYPYTGEDGGDCEFNAANVGATISSYKDVSSGDENALLQAATIGPVSVAIDASHQSFQFYSGGIYYEEECSSYQLDHGVLVAGYGETTSGDYWLVKNSWGPGWGLSGYIHMARNRNNNCGIATSASYPIV